MIQKLYVFANMGYLDQLPKSGGQTSARRVMKGFEQAGFEVVPIRRHRSEWEGKLKHAIEIFSFALVDTCKIIGQMLFKSRRNSVFMHLTYAGPLVPFELLLTLVVRAMGYPCITYLKGGQVLDYYRGGSKLHKTLFYLNMNLQRKIFFEGMESLDLVKAISTTPLVYFPNYTFDNLFPDKLEPKNKNELNLLYFGRIAPNKNIHILIEVFNILAAKYENAHLTIIGGVGQSKAYGKYINEMIMQSPYKIRINSIGSSSFDFIKEQMRNHHIFIFPSKEPCEGHSNSLNEAMSQGLVPVVSDYHFNRTIVGDDRFVVNGYEANAYVEKIEYLFNNCDMNKLSCQVWEHVKNKYSYSIVNDRICDELRKMDC